MAKETKKKYVKTTIDDINLNARFYASMSKENAVKELLVSHQDKDTTWAGKAYDQMVKDVKDADSPKKEEDAKK